MRALTHESSTPPGFAIAIDRVIVASAAGDKAATVKEEIRKTRVDDFIDAKKARVQCCLIFVRASARKEKGGETGNEWDERGLALKTKGNYSIDAL